MAGYIGKSQGVTQVDGYNRSEADAEFVQVTGDTMTGALAVNGNLTVDTNTLFVNAATNRVGVGTNSPAVPLHVSGASVPVFVNSTDSNLFKLGLLDAGSTVGYIGAGSGAEFAVGSSTGVERMRIDASGNVGIGTSSPGQKFGVNGNAIILAGNEQKFAGPSNTNVSGIKAPDDAGSLAFITNNTFERVRINEGGKLYVNQTSGLSGARQEITYNGAGSEYGLGLRALADNTVAVVFRNAAGSVVGSISQSATITTYNTSSDYRLKENVVSLTGAADRLMQIPVCRFNFIVDPDRTVDGFLAHEVQAFVPECVTGEKDQVETVEVTDEDGNVTTETRPVHQGIDQSKLVPLLTAALQEALQKIDALEARIVSLEGGAA
jgi:hypothetical protein